MPSRNKYKYRRIEQGYIRVLILQPGAGSDPLRCQLDHVPLDEDANFDAISYCWGSPKKTHQLICDGKRMGITQSLREALWQFRHPDRSRRLWADAVCINQRNVKEKNFQVQEMHEVFRRAEHVLIWAGIELPTDAMLFSGISTVFQALKRSQPDVETNLWALLIRTNAVQHEGNPHILESFDKTHIMCAAFRTLEERPIFSRGWVFQEITLARRPILWCGTHFMNFDHFANTFILIYKCLEAASLWRPTTVSGMVYMTIEKAHSTVRGSRGLLEAALFLPGRFQCSMAQDYLYAARGLLDQRSRDLIPVNYDIEVRELYKKLIINAVQMQETDGLWDCLLYGQQSSAEWLPGRSMPSWVPNVHGESKKVDAIMPSKYNCRGQNERYFSDQPVSIKDGSILVMRGLFILSVDSITVALGIPTRNTPRCECCSSGTIHHAPAYFHALFGLIEYSEGPKNCAAGHTTSRMNLCYELAQMICNLRKLADFLMLTSASESVLDFVETWRAVCRDIDATDDRLTSDQYSVPETWLRLLQALPDLGEPENWGARHNALASLSLPEIETLISEFNMLRQLTSVDVDERVFGKTSSGQLGWFPKDTQHGDMICILAIKYSDAPVVLRPTGDGCFTIIGAAYVHGIMDGEAIPDSLEGLEDIRLV